MQVKLLRVLQEREIIPVGSTQQHKIDIRIIIATNRDLEEMVKCKLFREDLYYRINMFPLTVPPLRERVEDITPLANLFLKQLNRRYNYRKEFRPDVLNLLRRYEWPGNVRELKNSIEQALERLKTEHPAESTLKRPKEFFVDEITFIERFGFNNFAEYREAERIGRASSNIKRENRKWIFAVYEEYQTLRQTDGPKYDWDDLAFYVFRELQEDDSERRYTHIIVDEGQDFSPMMIKSLVAATAQDGSFTFFGDVAQQIYGSRLSWRDSGITTNKIWRFDVNYRNPESIVAFATAITETKYWRQDRDMVEATSQVAKGPMSLTQISFCRLTVKS